MEDDPLDRPTLCFVRVQHTWFQASFTWCASFQVAWCLWFSLESSLAIWCIPQTWWLLVLVCEQPGNSVGASGRWQVSGFTWYCMCLPSNFLQVRSLHVLRGKLCKVRGSDWWLWFPFWYSMIFQTLSILEGFSFGGGYLWRLSIWRDLKSVEDSSQDWWACSGHLWPTRVGAAGICHLAEWDEVEGVLLTIGNQSDYSRIVANWEKSPFFLCISWMVLKYSNPFIISL